MVESPFSKEENETWNSYFYPGTDVLKNKLGLINQEELGRREAEITFEKLVELYENPIKGNFDAEHLRSIHRYLFDEIYDWAGEYRNVHMRKEATAFTPEAQIEDALNSDLEMLNSEIFHITSKYELANFLAINYIDIQHIHPFREGNSRTIREFFRQFVLEKTPFLATGPLELDYSVMNPTILATARQFNTRFFPGQIAEEFYKALKPLEYEDTDTKKTGL